MLVWSRGWAGGAGPGTAPAQLSPEGDVCPAVDAGARKALPMCQFRAWLVKVSAVVPISRSQGKLPAAGSATPVR